MTLPERPFDRAAALENLAGDEILLEQVAGIFIEDWPANRDRLLAGVAAGNAATVAKEAHSIKGAVSNFCAARAIAVMAQLELAGKAGDLAQVSSLATGAVAAVEDVVVALRREAVV
jgi:HPt (histidine-containing phosphotransfer) domain-containing protein